MAALLHSFPYISQLCDLTDQHMLMVYWTFGLAAHSCTDRHPMHHWQQSRPRSPLNKSALAQVSGLKDRGVWLMSVKAAMVEPRALSWRLDTSSSEPYCLPSHSNEYEMLFRHSCCCINWHCNWKDSMMQCKTNYCTAIQGLKYMQI